MPPIDLLMSRDVAAIGVTISDGFLHCGLLFSRLPELTEGILYHHQDDQMVAYAFKTLAPIGYGVAYNAKLLITVETSRKTDEYPDPLPGPPS